MRYLPLGLIAFSLGSGGLKCLPITCLERLSPDPAEIRDVSALSLEGWLLSGGAESRTVL